MEPEPPILLIVTGLEPGDSRRFEPREDRFTIGRSDESGVVIPDKSVSKVHVVITRSPQGGYSFQDLWSQNGVFFNDERREAGLLRDGDVLRLGRVNILFRIQSAVPGPLPASPVAERGPKARITFTPRSILIVLLVTVGIGTGILFGYLGSFFSAKPGENRASPSGKVAAKEIASPAAKGDSDEVNHAAPLVAPLADPASESSSAASGAESRGRDPLAGLDREAREKAEGYLRDLALPYGDDDESLRVLFRLFLDRLARTPTRAEAEELAPLGPLPRWRRLDELASEEKRESIPLSFQRYLDREPSQAEKEALETLLAAAEKSAKDGAGGPSAGLYLGACVEYRRADFHRSRNSRQRAGSLLVDLLDRPARSKGELVDLEEALGQATGESASARVLAFSPEADRLPRAPDSEDGRRAWLQKEFFRFTLRPPTDDERRTFFEELVRGPGGERYVRLALATIPAYSSY